MSSLNHIEITVRVRYPECDPMNVAHHAAYPVWLEIARTELLRSMGKSYADMEKTGIFFVIARLNIRYRKPAHYDDELTIAATAHDTAGIKIKHDYEIHRGSVLLATATTTIVCVNAQGQVQPIPPDLFT